MSLSVYCVYVRKANSKPELSQLLFTSIRQRELVRVLMLSQSLGDLGTTRGECLGRTRWSSPLDWTTYLCYFTSGCTPIITRSHVLPEHSMITWLIWLSNLPCYLYLDPIVRLDVRDQNVWMHGNSFLPGALIIWPPLQDSLSRGIFPLTPIFVPSLLSLSFVSSFPLSV